MPWFLDERIVSLIKNQQDTRKEPFILAMKLCLISDCGRVMLKPAALNVMAHEEKAAMAVAAFAKVFAMNLVAFNEGD